MLRKVFRIENSVEINFGRKNHQVFHARPTVCASGQYFGVEKTPSHACYVADSPGPVRLRWVRRGKLLGICARPTGSLQRQVV